MAEYGTPQLDIHIIALGEDRVADAAAVMARAFQNDPILVFACPDAEARAHLLPWMFRWSAWKGLRFGELLGTADSLDGVAVLVAPGRGEFTAHDLARINHAHARAVVGPDRWDGVLAATDLEAAPAEAALRQAVPEPHWYLDALAVEPDKQGQGIGSELLREVAARTDASGLPIALLTCQPANLPLYRRHGYVVVTQNCRHGSPVTWWGMRREALSGD